jgi:hypothetical protein
MLRRSVVCPSGLVILSVMSRYLFKVVRYVQKALMAIWLGYRIGIYL